MADPVAPSTEPPFAADLLPLTADPYVTAEFRHLTSDGVSTVEGPGNRTFLEVEPEALRLLTATAMRDIAHLLRPGHLAQVASILDDPEASANDRFVATELLQNGMRSCSSGAHPKRS